MSLVLDGSAGITYPAGSNAQGAPSKVLQVVTATTATSTSTASTSFVAATNFSASITPLFSTSKIFVIVSGGALDTRNLNFGMNCTIYRNSTNLGDSSAGFSYISGAASRIIIPISMSYLDSPATTSSTTYQVYFSSSSGSNTVYINDSNAVGTITLMEIAQ